MSKIQEKNRFIGQRFQNLLSHSFTGLCISRRRLSACVRESGSSTAAATPADGSLILSLSLQSASTNWEQKFCNSHNPRLCKAWEMVKHFHSCLMPHHKLNKRLRKKHDSKPGWFNGAGSILGLTGSHSGHHGWSANQEVGVPSSGDTLENYVEQQ